jgi:phosphate starvation-inducible PhoH-like protein
MESVVKWAQVGVHLLDEISREKAKFLTRLDCRAHQHYTIDFDQTSTLLQRGIIEVAPLAFMRGRTLNDCFVILDEAQNTTSEQMKMFLTRLGISSKAVITGDITQIDLPNGRRSGLIESMEILAGIEGLKFVYFTDKDVIRHRLVQDIIKAYERADIKKQT